MNPGISVIVPVYNVKKYFNDFMVSLTSQTYRDLEVIIIDDGSTDGCDALCDLWADKDSRVIVVHQPNMGVSAARNTGLKMATGQYIAFADPDDVLNPMMYELMLKKLISEQADMAICGVTSFYEDEVPDVGKIEDTDAEVLNREQVISMFNEKFTGMITWVWNKLYTRELIGNNLFNTDFTAIEDIVFISDLMEGLTKTVKLNRNLYYYRQRRGSIMNTNSSNKYTGQSAALIYEFNRLLPIGDEEFNEIHLYSCLNKIANLEARAHREGDSIACKQLMHDFKKLHKENKNRIKNIKEKIKFILFVYFTFLYHIIKK